MRKGTAVLFLLIHFNILEGCISTARLSDFPKVATAYNFIKISNSKRNDKDKSWNSKSGFEYYLEITAANDSLVIQAIVNALRSEKYNIKSVSISDGAIFAERGMSANEWKTVTGVYYQKLEQAYGVYVKCKITQDGTGGWCEDRAKKIAEAICHLLKGCRQSYSVNTGL